MCTLLLWKHAHPRYALIAAANRDEYLDRPSTGPQVLADDPLVVGGRDEVAGGTWLAVNERGMLTALTNRRGAGTHDPTRRSRGRLVVEIARTAGVATAERAAMQIDPRAYNPFILVIADADEAVCVSAGDAGVRSTRIADGAHAITNWELDADVPKKAQRALDYARGTSFRPGEDAAAIARRLHAMLADHGDGASAEEALCVHRAATAYGTRSTTIALLGSAPGDIGLFYGEGPPCTSTLTDVSSLLRHESRAASPNH